MILMQLGIRHGCVKMLIYLILRCKENCSKTRRFHSCVRCPGAWSSPGKRAALFLRMEHRGVQMNTFFRQVLARFLNVFAKKPRLMLSFWVIPIYPCVSRLVAHELSTQ